MLRAVIFDMDGTLLDSEVIHYIVIHDILVREFGYDQSMEEYLQYCGIPDQQMWPMILRGLEDSSVLSLAGKWNMWCASRESDEKEEPDEKEKEMMIAALSLKLEQMHWDEYDEYIEKNGVEGFPGMRELLSALYSEGIRLAVATGSLERIVRSNMEMLGIGEFIDATATSEDCEKGKPDPDIFLLAAKRLGVEPADCLVVEDSRNGMIAADRAGMAFAGFGGAQMPADMELAPFVFSDYRKIRTEDLQEWHKCFWTGTENK